MRLYSTLIGQSDKGMSPAESILPADMKKGAVFWVQVGEEGEYNTTRLQIFQIFQFALITDGKSEMGKNSLKSLKSFNAALETPPHRLCLARCQKLGKMKRF